MRDELTALAWTLAIELPLYAVLLGRHPPRVSRWSGALVGGLAVNAISHPLAFLVAMPLLAGWPYPLALGVVEAGVLVLEWALLSAWTRDPWRAALAAGAANVASLSFGLLALGR